MIGINKRMPVSFLRLSREIILSNLPLEGDIYPRVSLGKYSIECSLPVNSVIEKVKYVVFFSINHARKFSENFHWYKLNLRKIIIYSHQYNWCKSCFFFFHCMILCQPIKMIVNYRNNPNHSLRIPIHQK